jgi:hypothetical protein
VGYHHDDGFVDWSEALPSLFTVDFPLQQAQYSRVVEDQRSRLKADFVLAKILAIFLVAPFEAHQAASTNM